MAYSPLIYQVPLTTMLVAIIITFFVYEWLDKQIKNDFFSYVLAFVFGAAIYDFVARPLQIYAVQYIMKWSPWAEFSLAAIIIIFIYIIFKFAKEYKKI